MGEPRRYPCCVMATCPVPWEADHTLAEEVFRDQVRRLAAAGYHHLYIFGTAGEGYAVSESQFDRVGRVFREETARADLRAMVGVISLGLSTSIERIERARSWGIRDFQISLPCWGALNDRELAAFFRETCGRFPDCRFMHYNLARAKRVITPEEYGRLEEEHPNLVATKHGGTDSISTIHRLLERAPRLQHFVGEAAFAHGSLVGECGLLISVALTNPAAGQAYFRAGRSRDVETLLRMERELAAATRLVLETVGGTAHMDGAYDKLFCKLHDPRFPLRLLPPYEGADDALFQRYVARLRAELPAWAPGGGE